tara:strand:+ start:5768 stop:6073 length:306 start_codon:yes stop_codon:yes gene_type:complete
MSWTEEEKSLCKEAYGCTILTIDCAPSDAKEKSLPMDAFLVEYRIDGEVHYDITRSSKESKLFDMYYDKFGKDFIGFAWASGTIKPKLWGYKAPEEKKKKR